MIKERVKYDSMDVVAMMMPGNTCLLPLRELMVIYAESYKTFIFDRKELI